MAFNHRALPLARLRSRLAMLAAVVLAVLPLVAAAQDAASPEASPVGGGMAVAGTVDLPAVVPSPADLEEIGIPGFGKFNNGFFSSLDFFVATTAQYVGRSEGEIRAFYQEIGWKREYRSYLGVPAVPGDPDSQPIRAAWGFVTEYADAAGAEAALAEVGNAADGTPWTIDRFVTSRTFGDGSALIRTSIPGDGDFPGQQELFVVFQVGNLLATAGLATNLALPGNSTPVPATPTTDAAEPTSPAGTAAEIEALAGRMQERIDTVLAQGDPGLAAPTLRLDISATGNQFGPEGYRLRDGELRPYYADRADDLSAAPDSFGAATEIYELEQPVQPGAEPSDTDSYVVIRLARYTDDAAASDAFARRAAMAPGTVGPVTVAAVEPVSILTIPGADESVVLAVDLTFDDGGAAVGYKAFMRFGRTVAEIHLDGSLRPDMGALEELAAAQARCLATTNPCATMSIPDALLDA